MPDGSPGRTAARLTNSRFVDIAFSKDGRADADMGRALLDGGLEVGAHAVGKDGHVVSVAQAGGEGAGLSEPAACPGKVGLDRGNEHEAAQFEVAAVRDFFRERIEGVRQTPRLGRPIIAKPDFDQDGLHILRANLGHDALHRLCKFRAVDRVDERRCACQEGADFVALQMPDKMPARLKVGERVALVAILLDIVFTEITQGGRGACLADGRCRMALGHADERHAFTRSPGTLARRMDATGNGFIMFFDHINPHGQGFFLKTRSGASAPGQASLALTGSTIFSGERLYFFGRAMGPVRCPYAQPVRLCRMAYGGRMGRGMRYKEYRFQRKINLLYPGATF